MIQSSGWDGMIVPDDNPQTWAARIEALYHDPAQLAYMRQATQEHMAMAWPSWQTVLVEDLLPVWRAVRQGVPLKTVPTPA